MVKVFDLWSTSVQIQVAVDRFINFLNEMKKSDFNNFSSAERLVSKVSYNNSQNKLFRLIEIIIELGESQTPCICLLKHSYLT